MALSFESNQTNYVVEGESDQVVYTAVVVSANGQGSAIRYELAPDSNLNLAIDAISGEVTYTGTLDFDTQAELTFSVVAIDQDSGEEVSQSITIQVMELTTGTAADDTFDNLAHSQFF